jgi:hypothetical protein
MQRDVRFWPKADMGERTTNVPFGVRTWVGAPQMSAFEPKADIPAGSWRFVIEPPRPLRPFVLVPPAVSPPCVEQASANFQLVKAKMLYRQFLSRPPPYADIFRHACETRLRRSSAYLFDR